VFKIACTIKNIAKCSDGDLKSKLAGSETKKGSHCTYNINAKNLDVEYKKINDWNTLLGVLFPN